MIPAAVLRLIMFHAIQANQHADGRDAEFGCARTSECDCEADQHSGKIVYRRPNQRR